MNTAHLIHSFWSEPQKKKQRAGVEEMDNQYSYLLCAALSVLYAKLNGCRIDLHADKAGIEMFGFLPYDNFYPTLENHNANSVFWASGKIAAMEAAPLRAAHIDMDVFLRGKKCIEVLQCAGNFDLIVQSFDGDYCDEYPNLVLEGRRVLPDGVADLPAFDISGNVPAYCCGLVAFNSQALKDKYIAGYKKICAALENSPELWNNKYCPDMLAEQAWIRMCAQDANAKVHTMIEYGQEFENDLLFTHLAYTSKFDQRIIKINEKMLEKLSPPIYSILMQKKRGV